MLASSAVLPHSYTESKFPLRDLKSHAQACVLTECQCMVQERRAGKLASVSEEEQPLPNESAVRHWLQYGRPPGSKVGGAKQVAFQFQDI